MRLQGESYPRVFGPLSPRVFDPLSPRVFGPLTYNKSYIPSYNGKRACCGFVDNRVKVKLHGTALQGAVRPVDGL